MIPPPLLVELKDAKNVLIAGTGGGFDFLCGLPLQLELEALGKRVHLANLSFTPLQSVRDCVRHTEWLYEATAASHGPDYFPESYLCRWFKERHDRNESIWCFGATGVEPYSESYRFLVERLGIDTILLVDGGVDSLLRGDEHSLGTPLWDALTMAAVDGLQIPRKYLATTAFGAERWDKISHSQAFARISDMTRRDALLGVSTLLRSTAEGAAFVDAAHYIFERQKTRPSIVISSMLSALMGDFGERPVNIYTENTPIWVSPLMSLYWFFQLDEVARQKRFLPNLRGTQTLAEAADRLQAFSKAHPGGRWESIPL